MPGATENPNIVFIDCHDLGDWLGCYGRDYVHSPNIDQLAGEGVVFTRYFATAPICGPSRISMYTGYMPHSVGVYGNSRYIPENDPICIPRWLRKHGYETFLCGSFKTNGSTEWAGYEHRLPFGPESDRTREFFAHRRSIKDEPFFAHFSFDLVHRPFGNAFDPDVADRIEIPPTTPDMPEIRKDMASLCHNVEVLDNYVGRILDALRENGFEDNTVVVFTTDHGAALARAKHTLYDDGIRTALVLKYPGLIHAGNSYNELLSNLDLLPTLVEIAGLEAPRGIQGASFFNLLADKQFQPRMEVLSEFTYGQRSGMQCYAPKRGLRTARYKYICNFTEDPTYIDGGFLSRISQHRKTVEEWPFYGNPSPEHELYDLQMDPYEQKSLADDPDYAGLTKELKHRLMDTLRKTGDEMSAGPVSSKKDSPIIQQWVKPENSTSYRLHYDVQLETKERPFD